MCFSFESSFGAWLIAVIIAIYLFYRNRRYDRWNAAFIFTFTLIQLLEAGIWSNKTNEDTNNCGLDDMYVAMILLVLTLQPLVQTYCGYRYTKSTLLLYLMFALMVILVTNIIRVSSNKNKFFSTVGKNGHLVWNVKNEKYSQFLGNFPVPLLYLIGLFLPLFYQNNGIFLLLVGGITAAFSFSRASTKEFGSLWCYTAVAYAFVSLLI